MQRRTRTDGHKQPGDVEEHKSLTEQFEENATKRPERPKAIDTSILIPSGITLLNCACSDNPFGAYLPGQIVTLPGGSVSGKTMMTLTMLAECCSDERFNEYDLIYDDGEESLNIDINYLFGEPLAQRIKPPRTDNEGEGLPSETIQDFKANILKLCKDSDKPFIYILDSLDSLTTTEELEKEYKAAIATAKSPEAVAELKGSYKTEKAKHIGEVLRMVRGRLKQTKSALFIVQQTRDNIGGFGKAKTTSGGNAPFFYSFHQVWLEKTKTHAKTVSGISRKIGSHTKASVTKNKFNGKIREVEFDIFYDYGIDDVMANIEFLVSCGRWKKTSQTIDATDFGLKGTIQTVAAGIEKGRFEKALQEIVGEAWNVIEESVRTDRSRNF